MGMTDGNITLKLVESKKVIEQNINVAIAKELNGLVNKKKKTLVAKVKPIIAGWIEEQPEIQDLLSGGQGSLAGMFGIRDNSEKAAVDAIIRAIVAATEIKIEPFDTRLNGKLMLNFQPSHFSNILGMPEGKVTTEKGVTLEWLSWLLIRGAETVVVGYEYIPSAHGRSHGGTMGKGMAFRVPPEFQGTATDNFITRAFSRREKDIRDLFAQILGG